MAEAVSFRRGSHDDHKTFRGEVGEVTYDTDNRSLWTHPGAKGSGEGEMGTELARADFQNCTVTNLATQFGDNNLAFADLSNITPIKNTDVAYVSNALSPLGYAKTADVNTKLETYLKKDFSNINPAGEAALEDLVEENFLRKDMTNVDTAILAGETAGLPASSDPLAYKDLSNINTVDLAENRTTDKNLMYSDLSNITNSLTTSTLDKLHADGIQLTSKLITLDTADVNKPDEYPTAISVKQKFDSFKALPEPREYESRDTLFASYSYQWQYSVEVVNGGLGYAQGDLIRIGSLAANVEQVTANGEIESVVLQNEYGVNEIDQSGVAAITVTGSGSGAIFDISSTEVSDGKVDWSALTGFRAEDVLFSNDATGGGKYIEERDDPISDTKIALETLGLNQQDLKADKVDKVSTTNQVYVTDASGNQTTVTYSSASTNNAIVMRNATGQITVPQTPVGNNDAVSKKYVDDNIINQIVDIEVTDATGVINIATHKTQSTTPGIKALIGGSQVSGSWVNNPNNDKVWTFTPTNPNDILYESWVITL